jgi:ABC-2 type transport system ATP-binding protein/lipopolysaccharide transport system ATP-binding protein
VGTGFHLELTGRENIYLNGVILGMSRRDVRNRFDEIVEFAGLERFLSTPVKRYSSGMYLRLAFAVAAHLDPDVLIVDEVLAVGDAEFQRKCLGRISEVEQEGRTVVFVSHDLHALGRVCKRALWIDAGRLKMDAPTSDVVRAYLASLGEAGSGTAELQRRAGPVTLRRIRVGTGDGAPPLRDEPLEIVVEFAVHESVLGLDLAIYVTSSDGVRLLDEALRDTYSGDIAIGEYRVSLTVPPILNVGEYTVGVWFGASYADFFDESALATFSLEGTDRSRPDRAVVLGLPMQLSPIAP